MSTIYELTGNMLALQQKMEYEDIDEQVFLDTMESLDEAFEDKAQSYAKVMTNLQADIEALDKEIERLQSRKKTLNNNIQNMKTTLFNTMQAIGKTKFKSGLFSFTIAKTTGSVVIDDDTAVSEDYLILQAPKIDKQAIKRDIQAGKQIDFAHIEQGETLRIR